MFNYTGSYFNSMSMNYADLYGLPSDLSSTVAPTSVIGPTQGSVVPATGKTAPSAQAGGQTSGVAFSWIGLIILLIVLRILYGMAK
jgi:hypothetical protein